ncbi:ribosome recycling factor [Candidatus Blochmannia ocreatus (nom. nud.)]|uniref:Ribosome-recycling factor n=1 Tax=Candidatus Blochmannia ocreatus (nom. nud.) TaxID=251538 RepID=A0ABY4STN9_9ENTR|nr:ribosome recycling factor [Candidatus Blochmannia ocreatus]URJ25340.1 ribosome recycling factor [Candidatus Blochmannia ocreatus]
MIEKIIIELESQLKKCINTFKKHINTIHIGKVSINMLNNIQINYYGALVPIRQVSNITVENPRTLTVNVFDIKIIKLVEKAINTSELELNPISCGNIIKIVLPMLTEERRITLTKVVRSESEKSKISIRNIRRIANDKIKFLLKNKEINEDIMHNYHNKIQKLTDTYIKEINFILSKKEMELMKF